MPRQPFPPEERRLVSGRSPGPGEPRVSLVTVVRNGVQTIERTIRSVLEQTFDGIEYLIVDGGSSDGTLDIVRRYEARLAGWVSEPDRGISDAFNKGVAAAQGRYVGLLNADDWMEPDQIERAVAALERSRAAFVFGDLLCHEGDGRPKHRIAGDPDYRQRIRYRMPEVNHPTMLVVRTAYETVGPFDLRYTAAMDYDWLLRADRAGLRGAYAPDVLGHMALSGVSDRQHLTALREVREIAVRHGYSSARAWLRYGYAAVKGVGQRALRRTAPEWAYQAIRGRVNRSYHPAR